MSEYLSASRAETEKIAAEKIAPLVKKGGFVALFGEMGAGKTVFVRGLVSALIPECAIEVHSPTFAIVNQYENEDMRILHYDLYRITDTDDLYSTGYYDSIGNDDVIITEWSELFPESIPTDALRVKIEKVSESERRITVC